MKRIAMLSVFIATVAFGLQTRGGDERSSPYEPRPASEPDQPISVSPSPYVPVPLASQANQPVSAGGASSHERDGRDLSLKAAKDTITQVKDKLSEGKPASPSEQAECLRLAAVLAELGGLEKDAKHLRDEAEKDRAPLSVMDVLSHRQAQLDALQAQVAALRRMNHSEQQIQVKVRMVEVSLTKMREAGIRFPELIARANNGAKDTSAEVKHAVPGGVLGVVNPEHEFITLIDDLKAKGIVRVLAEPTLATVSGRPAFFSSGGEFPFLQHKAGEEPTVEFKQFGIKVNLLGSTLGNDKLRLDVKMRCSELCDQLSVDAGGLKVPGLNVRECDTAVELRSGQTVILGGMSRKADLALAAKLPEKSSPELQASDKPSEVAEIPQETQFFVLLRAQIVEPGSEPTQSEHVGRYAPSRPTATK